MPDHSVNSVWADIGIAALVAGAALLARLLGIFRNKDESIPRPKLALVVSIVLVILGIGLTAWGASSTHTTSTPTPQIALVDTDTPVATNTLSPPPIGTFTPTPTPTNTFTPTPTSTPTETLVVEVLDDDVQLREGPGACYKAMGATNSGDVLSLKGRSPDAEAWWLVEYEGRLVWLFSRLARASQEMADVPTATAIPASPNSTEYVLCLVDVERQAALEGDINLIRMIYAPDAIRCDATSGTKKNAVDSYELDFENLKHLEIAHRNLDITMAADRAVITNDTRGWLQKGTAEPTEYDRPKGDEWVFDRDSTGRWWIVEMTYNLVPPWITYSFGDGTDGLWEVRHYENQPQGSPPTYTRQPSHPGDGSLRFAFDLPRNKTLCGQVIRYNLPFGGQASAHVYAPVGAPADLQAGFFAQDYDRDPYNPHRATNMVQLSPGQWTPIDWNIDVSDWEYPQHFVGIQICQAGPASYKGYVLIDDVSFSTLSR